MKPNKQTTNKRPPKPGDIGYYGVNHIIKDIGLKLEHVVGEGPDGYALAVTSLQKSRVYIFHGPKGVDVKVMTKIDGVGGTPTYMVLNSRTSVVSSPNRLLPEDYKEAYKKIKSILTQAEKTEVILDKFYDIVYTTLKAGGCSRFDSGEHIEINKFTKDEAGKLTKQVTCTDSNKRKCSVIVEFIADSTPSLEINRGSKSYKPVTINSIINIESKLKRLFPPPEIPEIEKAEAPVKKTKKEEKSKKDIS